MSRLPILLVALASLAAVGSAQPAEELAFVELHAPKDRYFVDESIRIGIRFGFEVSFLEERIIPLFRQRLDVPVQVEAPWVDELPGTVVEGGAEGDPGSTRSSFVLNDGVATAVRLEDETRDGRRFAVYAIERSYRATGEGDLAIPAPRLRFAHASRFEEDFLNGRVPLDRAEARIEGAAASLRVRDLPSAGRPAGFGGAVGRFEISADAMPRSLSVGESLKLVVRIEGEGNFSSFPAPRLGGLDGFHVYGSIEERGPRSLLITYDLSPLPDVPEELPALPFAYFDPTPPAEYRVIHTDPIPLDVEGRVVSQETSAEGPDRLVPGRDDIHDVRPVVAGRARELGGMHLLLALAVPALIGFLLTLWVRVIDFRRNFPEVVRARRAAARFRAALSRGGSELAPEFVEYVAARLLVPSPSVIAPDVSRRLVRAGIGDELARRTEVALEGLVFARYGSDVAGAPEGEIRELVETLEGSFRQREEATP